MTLNVIMEKKIFDVSKFILRHIRIYFSKCMPWKKMHITLKETYYKRMQR